MKYKIAFALISLVATGPSAWAGSELDSEINDLQVRIVRIPEKKSPPPAQARRPVAPKIYSYDAAPVKHKAQARPLYSPVTSAPYRTTTVASPTVAQAHASAVTRVARTEITEPVQSPTIDNSRDFTPTPDEPAPAQAAAPAVTSSARSSYSSTPISFLRKLELMPSYSISSFDGGDSSNVIPSGLSTQYNNSFLNVSLLGDIDFGSSNFVGETGILVTQMGSYTGLGYTNIYTPVSASSYSEKITLTYLALPLNAKWLLSGEGNSSFYVKGGLMPMFMIRHDYWNNTGVNQEIRLGSYNTFDVTVDGGIGFDLKITQKFHGIAELSGFQGFLPVSSNYNIYNYGFMMGLGLGYML